MKNRDKYKTVKEQVSAFNKFCESANYYCPNCMLHRFKGGSSGRVCIIRWLDLEAEEEPDNGNKTT